MASGCNLPAELVSVDSGKLKGAGSVNALLGIDEKHEDKPDDVEPVSDSSSDAHVCPKALEAGFPNVKRKGDKLVVDWDGPNDPCNPLK